MQSIVIVDTPIYTKMCMAIAECAHLDEVKQMRDVAMALEVYGKQMKNVESERLCTNVRLRAERKVGELLNNIPSEKSHKGKTKDQPDISLSGRQSARDKAGISESMGNRCQQLASIPEDDFNEALNDPSSKPSRDGIIKKLRPVNEIKGNPLALEIWGILRDFENRLETTPFKLLQADMTDNMVADCNRLKPRLIEWLKGGL